MRLRVIIADDEPLARDRLRRLLEHQSQIEILSECATGKETLEAIQLLSPDLVLMDVRMPDMNAFEVMEALGEQPVCAIVLVTAHEDYALRAFETQILDYLLKPFDSERLGVSIQRVRERLQTRTQQSAQPISIQPTPAAKPTPKISDRIAVKVNGRIVVLRLADIVWLQGANNYSKIHSEGKEYLIRKNLGALVEEFPQTQFLQISRSLVVNVECIREIRPKSHGDYVVSLKNGHELNASRNYRTQLLERLARDR